MEDHNPPQLGQIFAFLERAGLFVAEDAENVIAVRKEEQVPYWGAGSKNGVGGSLEIRTTNLKINPYGKQILVEFTKLSLEDAPSGGPRLEAAVLSVVTAETKANARILRRLPYHLLLSPSYIVKCDVVLPESHHV